MVEFKSKDGTLLAIHCLVEEFERGRVNICPNEQFLQVGVICEKAGKKYAVHKHLICDKLVGRTQEIWVVVGGVIRFKIYDFDKQLVSEMIVKAGDCIITFAGYHEYEIVSYPDARVYEIKSGPYLGKEKDKEYMDGT